MTLYISVWWPTEDGAWLPVPWTQREAEPVECAMWHGYYGA